MTVSLHHSPVTDRLLQAVGDPEADLLLRTAAQVGKLHAQGAFEELQEFLVMLGMPPAEAASYEGKLQGASSTGGRKARNNTELAQSLGILVDSAAMPRNQLLYRLLELHYPDLLKMRVLGEEHIGGKKGKRNPRARRVLFDHAPCTMHGETMSVHRVYLGEKPAGFQQEVVRQSLSLRLALGEKVGLALGDLLVNQQMLFPPPEVAALLSAVLTRGREGKKVTLVGAFCPDYAYEETGNPSIPYRYTFNGVGEGVGLVAQQFARVIPPLSRFLTEAGIEHEIVLGIGDFEADVQSVLTRVGADRETFIARCARSLEAFRKQVGDGLPLRLELCDAHRNAGRLRLYAKEATDKMLAGDFGKMPQLYPDLAKIIGNIGAQYRTFYGRWHGRQLDDQEVMRLVLEQGGEYAALTRIYAEDFGDNAITIAGDRPQMHLFNSFFVHMPVLCVKRVY